MAWRGDIFLYMISQLHIHEVLTLPDVRGVVTSELNPTGLEPVTFCFTFKPLTPELYVQDPD